MRVGCCSVAAAIRQQARRARSWIAAGGIPVAYEVALALGAPLDVPSVIAYLHITDDVIERITRTESIELQHREELYRPERRLSRVQGQRVILVDDGRDRVPAPPRPDPSSRVRFGVGAVRNSLLA